MIKLNALFVSPIKFGFYTVLERAITLSFHLVKTPGKYNPPFQSYEANTIRADQKEDNWEITDFNYYIWMTRKKTCLAFRFYKKSWFWTFQLYWPILGYILKSEPPTNDSFSLIASHIYSRILYLYTAWTPYYYYYT